jgi:hypothetical protein
VELAASGGYTEGEPEGIRLTKRRAVRLRVNNGKRLRRADRLRLRQQTLMSRRRGREGESAPETIEEPQEDNSTGGTSSSVDIFSLADKWLAGAAFTPVEKLIAAGTLALTLWWIISPSTFLFGLLGGQADVGSAWDRVWLALLMIILLGIVYLVRAVRRGL